MHTISWLLAAITALWLGFVSWRAGRNWVLWVVGGASYALVAATYILGIAHAAFIPSSPGASARYHTLSVLAAVLVIALIGLACTASLRRGRTEQESQSKNAVKG